jgi:TolA-binding protein
MKPNPTTVRGIAAAFALVSAAGISPLGAEEKPAAQKAPTSETEGKPFSDKKLERLREDNKTKARNRAAEDSRHYKAGEITDIENLYQVANRDWRSDDARASLKTLLDKYDKSNRTGCATLYLGQMSKGKDRIDYLTQAVEKFSDCYYLDGCQVGGYGRLVLAQTLWQSGEKGKAKKLLGELKTKYKDAIDHKGRPMAEIAEAAEKEFAK